MNNILKSAAMQINRVKVEADDNGIRLDRWFRRHHRGLSFVAIAKLARTGQIRLNGGRVQVSDKVETGDEIRYPDLRKYLPKENEVRKKAELTDNKLEQLAKDLEDAILYMDEDLIVLNKPAGLATQGGNKIVASVDSISKAWTFGKQWRPKIVHRLDKDTTGVLLLARTPQVAAMLAEGFRNKTTQKIYLAVLNGVPRDMSGRITAAIGKEEEDSMEFVRPGARNAKPAITDYNVVDFVLRKAALVEFRPITGRTHQLRVHSSILNCPILGDAKYGRRNPELMEVNQRKLHLHAYSITVEIRGKKRTFKAPIPGFFKETLDLLGLEKP
ncbi:MAG: RluA family pseudouridine synthase [Proteobacteria bacterium]|nr:RluA family pseudouridine synthase [Pseudomonadota bacterium]